MLRFENSNRTHHGGLRAKQALSQLSYIPTSPQGIFGFQCHTHFSMEAGHGERASVYDGVYRYPDEPE